MPLPTTTSVRAIHTLPSRLEPMLTRSRVDPGSAPFHDRYGNRSSQVRSGCILAAGVGLMDFPYFWLIAGLIVAALAVLLPPVSAQPGELRPTEIGYLRKGT